MRYVLYILITLFLPYRMFAQQDKAIAKSSERQFTLIGMGYGLSYCRQDDDRYFGYSYELLTTRINSYSIEMIHHFKSPLIGFHVQVRYSKIEYAYRTSPDNRHATYSFVSPYNSSYTGVRRDILTCAPYFAITTKGKHIWGVAEIGVEVNKVFASYEAKHNTSHYFHYDSTVYVDDSTIVTSSELRNDNLFRWNEFGFRIGVVAKAYKSLYCSLFVRPRFFRTYNFVPVNGIGGMFTFSFALYFRIP